VIDLAKEIDDNGWTMDRKDLFTAAMFELLAGKTQVMDQHFVQ
jgi:hypothetical protein